MLAKIIGTLWIILGLLWSIKPHILKNRLKRKMARKIKWIILAFVLVFGFTLLGSIITAQEIFLKVIGLIGLIIVIKGIFLLSTKTSDKIIEWMEGKPLIAFRIWGLFILGMGVMLFFI